MTPQLKNTNKKIDHVDQINQVAMLNSDALSKIQQGLYEGKPLLGKAGLINGFNKRNTGKFITWRNRSLFV